MLWCWRCKMEVPTLDEAEYAEVAKLYREATLATEDLRREKSLMSHFMDDYVLKQILLSVLRKLPRSEPAWS
jgi:hypothetical protein